jgi:hypothetical protein
LSLLHDAEHDRRLVELCAQGGDPRGELARSELRDCQECRSTLDDMLSSEDQLNHAGAEFRRASEAAASLSDVPGEERVELFLRERLAASGAPSAPRPRRWLGPALLAAGLLLGITVVILATRDQAATPVFLGPGVPSNLVPAGPVERWAEFTWDAELPEDAWFKVLIYDSQGGPSAPPAVESPRLEVDAWSPSAEAIAKFPRRVRWEVRVLDSSGSGVLSSASSEAWLSSP